MTYVRGTGSVEVELSKVQSWTENADEILFGRNGNPGVVREHQDDRATRRQREEDSASYIRRVVTIVAILGTAVPIIIKILELFHVLPK